MSLKQIAANIFPGSRRAGVTVKAAPVEKKIDAASANPYTEARREWNERYGDYISQAKNWRLCAIISGLVALVSVIGVVYIGAQNKIVPYVVQVDKNGLAEAIGFADKTTPVDSRVMKAYLARFITDFRTISPDQVAEKTAVERVYAMLSTSSSALIKINEYFRANNPFVAAQTNSVSVEVANVLLISGSTWQIEWTEVKRNAHGELVSTTQMRASVISSISPPTEERLVLINPLGIYVTDLNWARSI